MQSIPICRCVFAEVCGRALRTQQAHSLYPALAKARMRRKAECLLEETPSFDPIWWCKSSLWIEAGSFFLHTFCISSHLRLCQCRINRECASCVRSARLWTLANTHLQFGKEMILRRNPSRPDNATICIATNYLCKLDRVAYACQVLIKMDGVVDPCNSFFNTLVSVVCQEGSPDIGLLYMPQCKVCAPNLYIYGILIDGFTKAGGTRAL